MPRRNKILIALAIVISMFLLLTGLILPEVIERQAKAWVASNTARQLELEDVTFNPFNGKMTVVGYRLTEPSSDDSRRDGRLFNQQRAVEYLRSDTTWKVIKYFRKHYLLRIGSSFQIDIMRFFYNFTDLTAFR